MRLLLTILIFVLGITVFAVAQSAQTTSTEAVQHPYAPSKDQMPDQTLIDEQKNEEIHAESKDALAKEIENAGEFAVSGVHKTEEDKDEKKTVSPKKIKKPVYKN